MRKLFYIPILVAIVVFFTYNTSQKTAEKWSKSDKFTVINVQGIILFKKSRERMKRGDIYIQGTPLDFADEIARAAIINKLKGRYVLSGNKKGKMKLLPAANNISSRSGAILNIVDLKNHFSDRIVIIDKTKVKIGADAFPMNDKKFFYLTYQHEGEEIPKKLSFEGDYLILDKEDIFKIDGNPIPVSEKEMTLYYHEDGSGTKINSFTPIFPSIVDLKKEVSLILQTYKDETDEKKMNEVTAYINEFYGRPQKDNLKNWMNLEFEMTK